MESSFWPTLYGSALGVAAGVLVQLVGERIGRHFSDRNIRKAIKTELQFNLAAVDHVGEVFRGFRDAVNGDAPANAATYVPCDRGLHVQTNSLVTTARLYDFYTEDKLKKLWTLQQFLSPVNGKWFSDNLEDLKQKLIAEGATRKPEAVNFLNFADSKVNEVRADLQSLLSGF